MVCTYRSFSQRTPAGPIPTGVSHFTAQRLINRREVCGGIVLHTTAWMRWHGSSLLCPPLSLRAKRSNLPRKFAGTTTEIASLCSQ